MQALMLGFLLSEQALWSAIALRCSIDGQYQAEEPDVKFKNERVGDALLSCHNADKAGKKKQLPRGRSISRPKNLRNTKESAW
eukprot:1161016-Pelagomonas_calceolata.AAC.8